MNVRPKFIQADSPPVGEWAAARFNSTTSQQKTMIHLCRGNPLECKEKGAALHVGEWRLLPQAMPPESAVGGFAPLGQAEGPAVFSEGLTPLGRAVEGVEMELMHQKGPRTSALPPGRAPAGLAPVEERRTTEISGWQSDTQKE